MIDSSGKNKIFAKASANDSINRKRDYHSRMLDETIDIHDLVKKAKKETIIEIQNNVNLTWDILIKTITGEATSTLNPQQNILINLIAKDFPVNYFKDINKNFANIAHNNPDWRNNLVRIYIHVMPSMMLICS